jgi:rhodanese-related sulfurtransferase
MSDVERISPEEAKRRMDEEGYVYLDVRSETEYSAGHPAGAHNVPLRRSGPGGMVENPDFLAVVLRLYAKDQAIVVGCASGGRSLRAATVMIAAGFTRVVEQRAGFGGARDAFGQLKEPGWAAKGLPVATESPGCSYAELSQKDG